MHHLFALHHLFIASFYLFVQYLYDEVGQSSTGLLELDDIIPT